MSKYSDIEDFEYSGDCSLCGDPMDSSEASTCEQCGAVFHWGECGEWGESGHTCNTCLENNED